ncbi:MAG: hypothetical protein NT150_01010 [Bacteroidetes bacterium]|nr:hypothetical protein [Bacteroidota bacterium]
MKKIIVILLILALLLGCDKAKKNENGYQVFIIKKGHHESFSAHKSLNDSVLKFKAIFDSSAIYTIAAAEDVSDVNKLFGMTDCGVANHVNSARIGWRWFQDSLQLFAYVYSNGKRTITYMTSALIGKEINCSITATKDKYLFWINNVFYSQQRNCNENDRFMLYPFFGGNTLAPHNISIKIAY